MFRNWNIQDPLGELFKMVNAFDRFPGAWQIEHVKGIVYTGVSRKKREDGRTAWIAILTKLTDENCHRLAANNHVPLSRFRRFGGSVIALQMRIDPAAISSRALVEQAQSLVTEAAQLTNISGAMDVTVEITSLVGEASAALRFLPTPSSSVARHWDDRGGWLAEGEGSLTGLQEGSGSFLLEGCPDGLRVEQRGSLVRIAAAGGASSYLIEECRPETTARPVLDIATGCFSRAMSGSLEEMLGVDDHAGQRRLFHVEHTVADGTSVFVFDAWTRRMVLHDRMTDALRKAILDPDGRAAGQLSQAASMFLFECRIGRLGNPSV